MQIQIGIYVFEIPERYAPGEPLGEAEATYLNNARAGALTRVVEGRVRAAVEAAQSAGRELLSEAELEELQAWISLREAEYQLTSAPAKPKYGTIDHQARVLALGEAQAAALAQGRLLTEAEAKAEVERRCREPALRAKAREMFLASARSAKLGLESLL